MTYEMLIGLYITDDGSTYLPENPYAQAKRCIELIQKTLQDLNWDLSCIVRTRMFVTDISLWEEFGKAHAEYFIDSPPATSMIEVSRLINQDMLIEIEAEAIVNS